jgi:hypothetical protein
VLHCGDKQYLTFNEAVRGYKMRVQEQSDTTLSDDDFELPPEIRADYTDFRVLPDGRLIGVKRLLFHWTIHVDINLIGYEDRYCFCTYELAKAAFDGIGTRKQVAAEISKLVGNGSNFDCSLRTVPLNLPAKGHVNGKRKKRTK